MNIIESGTLNIVEADAFHYRWLAEQCLALAAREAPLGDLRGSVYDALVSEPTLGGKFVAYDADRLRSVIGLIAGIEGVGTARTRDRAQELVTECVGISDVLVVTR